MELIFDASSADLGAFQAVKRGEKAVHGDANVCGEAERKQNVTIESLRCVDTTRLGVMSWLQEFYFEPAVSALPITAVERRTRECG